MKCVHGNENPFKECSESADEPCQKFIPYQAVFAVPKKTESIGASALPQLTRAGVKKDGK